MAGALADCDRVLAADPDEPAALALKARLYLRAGRTLDALSLADLMELRAPRDYRGPLIAGLALAALGRDREALHALNRAIEREPEAAEVSPYAHRCMSAWVMRAWPPKTAPTPPTCAPVESHSPAWIVRVRGASAQAVPCAGTSVSRLRPRTR